MAARRLAPPVRAVPAIPPASPAAVTPRPERQAKVAPGNYGPVPAMTAALLRLAQSGALNSQPVNQATGFYQDDYTKSLLFLADGTYLGNLASVQHLGGDQWGMMKVIASAVHVREPGRDRPAPLQPRRTALRSAAPHQADVQRNGVPGPYRQCLAGAVARLQHRAPTQKTAPTPQRKESCNIPSMISGAVRAGWCQSPETRLCA
jgi:hypothetical protein